MPYTDKQKAAYWKKQAMGQVATLKGKGSYTARPSMARARYGAASGPSTMVGRGGYYDTKFVKTMKKYIPPGAFASGGRLVAGPLGGVLGTLVGKLAGFGSYKVSRNSLMVPEGTSPAYMHSSDTGLRVRHREYITDIVSSGTANTFKSQSFSIQPGLVQTFPWLAPIAQQYEEYEPRGVVFEFKTLSSTAIASSTNTTMGGIIMATDYNAVNAAFINKQQMDNTEYTVSAPIYESFYHPVECASGNNPTNSYYIRSGAPPPSTDIRAYDQGLFQIASFGVQGTNVTLGELWVTYEYELRKPVSTSALGQDVLTDHFQLGSVTNTASLGTTSVLAPNSSIGGAIVATGTTYAFPPVYQEGTYLVYWLVFGTGVVNTNPTITLVNCTAATIFRGDTNAYQFSPITGTTSATQSLCMVITLTGAGATIQWSGATSPTAITSGDLFVTQFDSSIVN